MVFLFCATAFGVVLTLGGLRYSTVETEIYLLTTQLLDLQAAAALSLLQMVVVTGLLLRRRERPAPTPTVVARLRGRARRPATTDVPAVLVTLLALLLVAVPIATLVAGSLRVDGGWGLGQLPRADHHRHRPGAAGAGDRGAGQLAAHRRRRDLDVAVGWGCWSRSW